MKCHVMSCKCCLRSKVEVEHLPKKKTKEKVEVEQEQ